MSQGVMRAPAAEWPLRLPEDLTEAQVTRIRADVEQAVAVSDYGWGHTIDFGPFRQEGLLSNRFLDFVGALDTWGWWPQRLDGLVTADIGAFTGGVSAIMAHRGAARVYAVDEMDGHVQQARVLRDAFGLDAVEPTQSSLYQLPERLGEGSLDLILCGGVLYHCSDMLVAVIAMQQLLKPGGHLLLETNAVRDYEHSYANFGRFVAGMWWQPTAACLLDLCSYSGLEDAEVRFYHSGRALLRATKPENARVKFRRGMNWSFEDVHDDEERGMDPAVLAPAPLLLASPSTSSEQPAAKGSQEEPETAPEPSGRELLQMVARRGSRSALRRAKKALRSTATAVDTGRRAARERAGRAR